MNVRVIRILAATLVLVPLAALADPSAQELMEGTTSEVLQIIRDNRARVASDPAYIDALVNEKIVPHLDFYAMTRLALAAHWKQATKEQRKGIATEFRQLLLRTYGKSLAAYQDQRIVFKPYQPGSREDRAVVRSEFISDTGKPVPVDYKLRMKNGWKIYDIRIDGISLVSNYRSSFDAEIQQAGIQGLLDSLREKNQTTN